MTANCICNSNVLQDEDDINNIKKNKTTKDEKINFNTIKTTFLSNLFDFKTKFWILFYECYDFITNNIFNNLFDKWIKKYKKLYDYS